MKLVQTSSAGVKCRVLEYEDAEIQSLVAQGGKPLKLVTDCVNADRRQKVALVKFRDDLSEAIHKLFPRKTKTVTKDNEPVEQFDETEGEHIDRFGAALASAAVTPEGFTLTGTTEKEKEACATAYIQSIANGLGSATAPDGGKAYQLDINRPDVVRSSGPGIAKEHYDAADACIAAGAQGKWAERFKNGYTSAAQVAVPPIEHDNFLAVALDDATPEAKQAVHESNRKALAKAIRDARKAENAAKKGEFAV